MLYWAHISLAVSSTHYMLFASHSCTQFLYSILVLVLVAIFHILRSSLYFSDIVYLFQLDVPSVARAICLLAELCTLPFFMVASFKVLNTQVCDIQMRQSIFASAGWHTSNCRSMRARGYNGRNLCYGNIQWFSQKASSCKPLYILKVG